MQRAIRDSCAWGTCGMARSRSGSKGHLDLMRTGIVCLAAPALSGEIDASLTG